MSPILVDFHEPSNKRRDDAFGLTREQVLRSANIYLVVKRQLMQFDDVTEDFAREQAEYLRDCYVRRCHLGRVR